MARRKLSVAERWQAIGMSNAGRSTRSIGNHFNVNHTVIVRLLQRHLDTGTVNDRPRSGRPRLTTRRNDRLLIRRAKANPFTPAPQLRHHWPPGGRVSVRTLVRRLHRGNLRARRVVKRPALTARHRIIRLQWANDHRRWNMRSWQKIHWSDESRFLLRPVDGRIRVWRENKTAYAQNNICPTTAFGAGGVTVWGCFSYRCKLGMHILQGNMNGQTYRDLVLRNIVVPHFDNHPLASRPLYMDDNARPHRARIVTEYKEQESIDTIFWPSMSPDMNPIEHVWDTIGRNLNRRDPPLQNLGDLRVAIVDEWNRFPQLKFRRLVQSMRRRVMELYRKRGGYTSY